MKKNKSILLGLVIIVVVFFVAGCGLFYNLVHAEDFKSHFGALGYTISDTEVSEYEADSYLVATKEDVPYSILYYEFTNEIDAKKVYEKYKKNISSYITTNSANQETTGAVFSKTVARSTDEYIVISRVKNTLIFIATTKDFESEVDKLLTDIKY